MSGESQPYLGPIDPLIAQSLRTRCRVRLVLRAREGDARGERLVEGVILELTTGRDQRARLRVGIPTGTGEPVEVRVLLENVDRIEAVTASDESTTLHSASEAPMPARPTGETRATGSGRRATLAFGTHVSEVRLARDEGSGAGATDRPTAVPEDPERAIPGRSTPPR